MPSRNWPTADNSLQADAAEVDIHISDDSYRDCFHVMCADNDRGGMSPVLREAMRFCGSSRFGGR
jgi:hypothetical protein